MLMKNMQKNENNSILTKSLNQKLKERKNQIGEKGIISLMKFALLVDFMQCDNYGIKM